MPAFALTASFGSLGPVCRIGLAAHMNAALPDPLLAELRQVDVENLDPTASLDLVRRLKQVAD